MAKVRVERFVWQPDDIIITKRSKQPIEDTLKHQAGRHNQKRHAWRYGSTSAIRRSLTATRDEDSGHPAWEAGEYKARARARAMAGASSADMARALNKTNSQAHRVMIAEEWLKVNAHKDGSFQIHGMAEKEGPLAEVPYKGMILYYPNNAQMRKQVASSMALWEAWGIHTGEGTGLPEKLSKHTNRIVFSTQPNKDDDYWAKTFNEPGFKSAATGGDGSIVIYSGAMASKSTIAHEMGHNLARAKFGSPQPTPNSGFGKLWSDFYNRQDNPGLNRKPPERPVRRYGEHNSAEDFATSMELYHTQPDYMKKNFPKRFRAMKKLMGD